jgi:hypothetical protein
MSVLAALVAAVVLGLTGLAGTSLAATSQPVAHPDGGSGTGTKVPEFFGFLDGQYARGAYTECPKFAEKTGIKVPLYSVWYGTPSAAPGEEAFGEAEFEVSNNVRCGAAWVTVRYKEPNPRFDVVINTKRLHSSKSAETSIAQVASVTGPLYGEMLDDREGCIQAAIHIDGTEYLGITPKNAEMHWGNCVPPWLETPKPEPEPKTVLPVAGINPLVTTYETVRTEITETRAPAIVPAQPEPKGGIGTAFRESRRVVKRESKVKPCRKHGKRATCKKAKGRKLRKKHRRPNGITIESAGGA